MSETNLFGKIVTAHMVEAALVATLEHWIDDYLGELERLSGYTANQLARPKGVITAAEFAHWNEDQLPLILVISPGLEGRPARREGRGGYDAAWSVSVAAICSDVTDADTHLQAVSYGAAIRAAIMQHSGLRSPLHPNGFAQFTEWVDESYSDIPFAEGRVLDSARVVFSVGVEQSVVEQAGPRTPSENPAAEPPGLPVATDIDVGVTPVRAIA